MTRNPILLRSWSSLDVFLQLVGALAAVGAGTARPLMTLVFGRLVNTFNNAGTTKDTSAGLVNHYSVYFVYLFLGQFMLTYVYSFLLNTVATRVTCRLRRAYLDAIINQDLLFFETYAPATVISDLSQNASTIEHGLSETLGLAIQAVSTVLTSAVIAFTQSWKLSLVMSTSVVALFASLHIIAKWKARFSSQIDSIQKEAAEISEEVLSSITIVFAYGAVSNMQFKYSRLLSRAKELLVKSAPLSGLDYAASYCILLCAYSLSFWYGTQLLSKHTIQNGGQVVIVILCVNQMTGALQRLIPSYNAISKAKLAAITLKETIALRPSENAKSGKGKSLSECQGRIEFQNVSFRYPSRPNVSVFHDLNLTINQGETTAIVGPSGLGKSSLINLIERWYEPESGRILLDDEPISDLSISFLRGNIGLVQQVKGPCRKYCTIVKSFQEPSLFNDTIFQNVANGLSRTIRAGLPLDQLTDLVHKACVVACVDGFVQQLPQKYQTVVGERSTMLSGGQRQRIAIARAIVSNPKILLLDEATSALDPNAEQAVQEALDRVSHGRTTLVIAHKLATIQKADKIVLLGDGCIAEQGSHESLLEDKGTYASIWNRQNLALTAINRQPDLVTREDSIGPPQSMDTEKIAPHPAINSETLIRPKVGRQQDRLSPLTCALLIFREQKKVRLLLLIGCLACAAAGAVYPGQAIVFAKSLAVLHQDKNLVRDATFWALLWFLLAIGVCLTFFAFGTIFTIVGSNVMRDYRGEYFSLMMQQDASFFAETQNSSAILTTQLVNYTQQLETVLSKTIGFTILVIVNVVSSCVLAIIIAWKLGLVAIFSVFPLIMLAGFLQAKSSSKGTREHTHYYEEVMRYATEAVACIRTVSALAMESEICEKFDQKMRTPTARSFRDAFVTMLLFALSQSANLLGSALCFWYGGGLVANKVIDTFQFFVVFIATVASGDAAGSFFAHIKSIVNAHTAANEIFRLRLCKLEASEHADEVKYTPQTINNIEFQNVSFAYPTRQQAPVLQRLNFRVEKGQHIAIVGISGSGKSTIVSLLERFYDPGAGHIRINDHPMESLDVDAYRSMVSLVSQDTVLYRGSIRENILLGFDEGITVPEETIINACREANIHDFIQSLPSGYDTTCGVRGMTFSGGQRQRIAIARALVRNSPVLLLDEATSALDSESESQVQEALSTAMVGRLSITIAHRLSTVKNADCIYVLSEGTFKEWGNHNSLLKKQGLYHGMCEAQRFRQDIES